MSGPRRGKDRLFWTLAVTALTLTVTAAVLGAGWEIVAASSPEPRWMIRAAAGGWLAGVVLAAAAAGVMFRGRRGRRG